MTKEQVERKEKAQPRVIIVECSRNGFGKYKPVIVGEAESNDISQFVLQELQELKERIKRLKQKAMKSTRVNSHHRLKGARVLADERRSYQKELAHASAKIELLEGRIFQPIRIIRKDDEIKSCEPTSFIDENVRSWWDFVRRKGLLLKVAEVNSQFPGSLDFLLEAYSIIRKMDQAMTIDEEQVAKKAFEDFRRRYRESPDDQAIALTPIMRLISESRSS